MADDIYNRGLVGEALPTAVDDEEWKGTAHDQYGHTYTSPVGNFRHTLAKKGSYFTANYTGAIDAATTLAGHPAPVLADGDLTMTKPFIFCRHGGASGTKLVYLDFIEIDVTVAGANGTSNHWSCQLDTGATRVTTAGTSLTNVNPNMQSSATSNLAVQAGVVVVGAESSNVRRLGSGTFRSTIEVAGDRYVFNFGQPSQAMNKVATAATVHQINLGPVILGPTDQFLLAIFQVAQDTAGIYRPRMGWWEI